MVKNNLDRDKFVKDLKKLINKAEGMGHGEDAFTIMECWCFLGAHSLPKCMKYSCSIGRAEDYEESMSFYMNFSYSKELEELFVFLWKNIRTGKILYQEMANIYPTGKMSRYEKEINKNKLLAPRGTHTRSIQEVVSLIPLVFRDYGYETVYYIWNEE